MMIQTIQSDPLRSAPYPVQSPPSRYPPGVLLFVCFRSFNGETRKAKKKSNFKDAICCLSLPQSIMMRLGKTVVPPANKKTKNTKSLCEMKMCFADPKEFPRGQKYTTGQKVMSTWKNAVSQLSYADRLKRGNMCCVTPLSQTRAVKNVCQMHA